MPAPTEKQLDLAKIIAQKNKLVLPVEVTKDMTACSYWINEHYEHSLPIKELVATAMKLAEKIGINPPKEVLESSQKLKFWITSKGAKPLTEKQNMALEENAPGEVLIRLSQGDYDTARNYLTKFYTKFTAFKLKPKTPPEGSLTRQEVMNQLEISKNEFWGLLRKGELVCDDSYIPSIISQEAVDAYIKRKKAHMEGLISISETCKQLHVNYEKVMDLMDSGVLIFEKVKGFKNVLIQRESLKNYVPPAKGARVTNLKTAYPGYITVQEAAKKLKLYPDAVKTLAKTGRLECITRETATNNILIKADCELIDIVSVKEAAETFNVTTHKVNKLLQEGKLETFTTDKLKSLVSLSSVRKALNIRE